ncbi:MAG: bifunctional adenosylcobinamide kinase/adenosylcobinamide-phosphate guanylyltransferase [Clostridia bacterium]|nr:bifunctional adenosylcobinamide kinase/adenosylcobinamide-phosphate guanylyltransferase [Clostridia bacterium]
MMILIIGGAASGKSCFAEKLSFNLKKDKLYYIATMKAWDAECEKRIEKHKKQRAGKGFITVESPSRLADAALKLEKGSVALLDCTGNLMANEMFDVKNADAPENVMRGVMLFKKTLEHFVIVSNHIFSDGESYEEETMKYIKNMGILNQKIAEEADIVIEVCCGIPIILKGRELFYEIGI